jgi:hypothetical protein
MLPTSGVLAMCDRSRLKAENEVDAIRSGKSDPTQADALHDAEFRRVDRKIDALAAEIVRRIYEILDKADPIVAHQYAVESLALGPKVKDEQLFKWLLESLAAQALHDRSVAGANLHPLHETLN